MPLRTRAMDRGASLIEYVLLVALIALAAVGALVYLGKGAASPPRAAGEVATGLGVGAARPGAAASGGSAGGASGGSPASGGGGGGGEPWCTSNGGNCTAVVNVGEQRVIDFWADGGKPPYTYALQGAPTFMTLDSQDREIVVLPTDCSQGGTSYSAVKLVVRDSATPPGTGTLTFSVRVKACTASPVA